MSTDKPEPSASADVPSFGRQAALLEFVRRNTEFPNASREPAQEFEAGARWQHEQMSSRLAEAEAALRLEKRAHEITADAHAQKAEKLSAVERERDEARAQFVQATAQAMEMGKQKMLLAAQLAEARAAADVLRAAVGAHGTVLERANERADQAERRCAELTEWATKSAELLEAARKRVEELLHDCAKLEAIRIDAREALERISNIFPSEVVQVRATWAQDDDKAALAQAILNEIPTVARNTLAKLGGQKPWRDGEE